MQKKTFIFYIFIALTSISCMNWENFITYYNTYYNTERIIKEVENEFEYQDERKRITPRSLIPREEIFYDKKDALGPPNFMRDFIVTQQKRQPVKTKLDSIEIKGSKILAHRSKSKFVEGTLFLMAKAYFYDNAWLNSQIKTSELIDRYPDGDWSPDAHLLMAKNYLIQRKFYEGKLVLSRTVDIAWHKERYDILSEAFRLEAELALFQDDIEGAYRPYLQAIAQSGDNDLRAKWQFELAAILFRAGKFDRAEKEFAKVFRFSPDYITRFEAKLYRASSLARIGRFEEAEKLLDELDKDRKFEEWAVHVLAERMNLARLQKDMNKFKIYEKIADSAYANHPALMTPYYELGMQHFREKDYSTARTYFARSKGTRSPVFESSQRLYFLINDLETRKNKLQSTLLALNRAEEVIDSTGFVVALELFEVGRIHEQLGNPDSARYYYELAVRMSPKERDESARYLYVYALSLKDLDPIKSDSLLDVIAHRYPFTEYGKEAIKYHGYTAEFVIDTVAELYQSGDRFRRTGQFRYAIDQFRQLYYKYPDSKYAPKSIYTIGWIYENNLQKPDSALLYYQLLLKSYPHTEYANDVRLSVAYILALRSGGELPDSLKPKVVVKPTKGDPGVFKTIDNPQVQEQQSLTPENILNAPGKFFEGIKEGISKPLESIKEFKLPENPFDLLKSDEKKSNEENSEEDIQKRPIKPEDIK